MLEETGILGGVPRGQPDVVLTGEQQQRLPGTGVLTVSRVVVELSPRFHPDGGRFLVKDYPKDGSTGGSS
jgi:hypothetical protein